MIKITVRQNIVKPPPGKKVVVNVATDTFSSFLNICSETMNIKAKIIFDNRGFHIHTIHELIDSEIYYVSEVTYLKRMFNKIIGRIICEFA